MGVDITYVIDHGYTDCIHNETEQLLLQNVRSRFVPWSLTDRGLQAGLFMAACRSLLTLYPENETYKVSLLKYKSECIEILRTALSDPDQCISDHTIALALVLSTEEVSLPTKAMPIPFVEIVPYKMNISPVSLWQCHRISATRGSNPQNGSPKRRIQRSWSWGPTGIFTGEISLQSSLSICGWP